MAKQDYTVIALVFAGGFCGIVAGADPTIVPPIVKLGCGATAAGIGGVLALMRPPSMPIAGNRPLPPAAPKTPPALRRRGRVTTPPPTPLTEPVVSTPAPPKRAAGQIPEVIGRG